MNSGNHITIPTVSEVVREATALCDPEGAETAANALYDGFEDDDRPVTAVESLTPDLLETVRAIDPEGDEPAALAAAATAAWLATHPDQVRVGDRAIREGVRLVFKAKPPPELAEWLAERGISY